MFKLKISTRLSIYLISALLIFSLFIGSMFIFFFKNYTLEIHKNDLHQRAEVISKSIAKYVQQDYTDLNNYNWQDNPTCVYGQYLRFIDDIAMADVWVVNRNMDLISKGEDDAVTYQYTDLPAYAYNITAKVFRGETNFTMFFSKQLQTPTLTVGTPIFDPQGEIIGAVLLHSQVDSIDTIFDQAISALGGSILIALGIIFIFALNFSSHFTKPLKLLKQNTEQISHGDYSVRNNMKRSDEIGDLATTMDLMCQKLEDSQEESNRLAKLRTDFVANVSHELRTPITVMRGSLEALKDGVVKDPEMVTQYHEQMLKETILLQRLVKDLLDLSKLQNHDFEIEKNDFDLVEVITDVSKAMSHLAVQKNIEIKYSIDYGYYVYHGDYERIRQLISVILDNAVKFGYPNTDIVLEFKNNILSVENKGQGLSKEDIPYIFERFYKSRSEENKTGTGLGLAIAKQIASRHDIAIDVQSIEGQWIKFNIYF